MSNSLLSCFPQHTNKTTSINDPYVIIDNDENIRVRTLGFMVQSTLLFSRRFSTFFLYTMNRQTSVTVNASSTGSCQIPVDSGV